MYIFLLSSFPKDPTLLNEWCNQMELDKENLPRKAALCSEHCQPNCFQREVDCHVKKGSSQQ